MQAAGDGGQGWGNALLYVFLSPTMRSMLFCDPCVALMAKRPNQNGPEQNGPERIGPERNGMLTIGAQRTGSNTTIPQPLTKRREVRLHRSRSRTHSKSPDCGPSDEGCHATPLAAATPSCETITSSMNATKRDTMSRRKESENFPQVPLQVY